MADVEKPGLFRAQALLFRQRQGEGRPRLVTPPGSGPICGLLIAILLAGLAYLGSSDYTRKATVSGYVQTSEITKRVYPTVTGTVLSLSVEPGEKVTLHQVLATLRTATDMSQQDRDELLAGYDRQIADATQQVTDLADSERAQHQELSLRIAAAHRALRHIRRMMRFQAQKVAQLKLTRAAVRPLFESKRLSRVEWQGFSGALLDGQQALERLAASASAKRDQVRELEIQLQKLVVDTRGRSAALRQQISRIEMSRRSLAVKAEAKITADIDGKVADVFVQPGDRVSIAQPLLSITPHQSHFVACLLIPSRAVGLLTVGQRVNLLYDAFPYEHFGTFRARIVQLSKNALAPGDSSLSLAGRQPFFKAIAKIDQPWVMVHGKRIPLRAGMSLRADIFLDRRTLLTWILGPLSALGARNL